MTNNANVDTALRKKMSLFLASKIASFSVQFKPPLSRQIHSLVDFFFKIKL
jgi:hypothetical protein